MIAILKYKHNCSAKHFIELSFSHLFSELVSLLWRISLFTSQIEGLLYARLYCMWGAVGAKWGEQHLCPQGAHSPVEETNQPWPQNQIKGTEHV